MYKFIINSFTRGFLWVRSFLRLEPEVDVNNDENDRLFTETEDEKPEDLERSDNLDRPDNLEKSNDLEEVSIDLYSLTPKTNSPALTIQIPEPKIFMFLDTETTGIPQQKSYGKYYEPHYINYYDGARMIELGYMICDDVGNIIKERSFLIKPNGFTIKNTKIHGIATEHAIAHGIPIHEALEIFYSDLKMVDKIICHNIDFDIHILLAECYREYRYETEIIKRIKSIPKKCTMEMGKRVFKLKKNPRLVELYRIIFENEPVQEHRALSDVRLCYDCYFNIHKSK